MQVIERFTTVEIQLRSPPAPVSAAACRESLQAASVLAQFFE
jgi:hypothetical protein